jgi:hypothetical protein
VSVDSVKIDVEVEAHVFVNVVAVTVIAVTVVSYVVVVPPSVV